MQAYVKKSVNPHHVSRQIEAQKCTGDDEEHLGDFGLGRRGRGAAAGCTVVRPPHAARQSPSDSSESPDAPDDESVQHDDDGERQNERENRVSDVEHARPALPILCEIADRRVATRQPRTGEPQHRTAQDESEKSQKNDNRLGSGDRAHRLST